MKALLLTAATFLGLTAAASAADLSARTVDFPVSVPVFTWNGFYVGVNAGYGWADSFDVTLPNGAVVRANSEDDGGFIGGAQIGYNYQIGSIVVGIEGDIQYADLGGATYIVAPGTVISYDNSDWFGTFRARAGVAFDRVLVYANGGFAFADNRTGWTVGGGVEYAVTNNLSLKVEGLYVNLQDDDFTFGGINYRGGDSDFGVVRAGLNYRFGTY